MAKIDEKAEMVQAGGFTFANHEKLHRAIHGSMTSRGQEVGGVGEDADPVALLAEYDRLGGLILKNGRKVKTGSFYDFEKRKPRAKPEIVLVLKSVEGGMIEVADGEEIPVEARAAEQAAKPKAAKPAKKGAKVADSDEE